MERGARIRKSRSESTKIATTDTAVKPYKFFFSSYNAINSIIIPCVSSEKREYIPIRFIGSDVVITNSVNTIYDVQKWIFGLLTSKKYMVWVKTLGGRLKSDCQYLAHLCYIAFPFPEINEEKKRNRSGNG